MAKVHYTCFPVASLQQVGIDKSPLCYAAAVLGWGQGGTGPQILPMPPNFFQGKAESMMISTVIPLSRCCLPNDEGPGPQTFFPRTATGVLCCVVSQITLQHNRLAANLLWTS